VWIFDEAGELRNRSPGNQNLIIEVQPSSKRNEEEELEMRAPEGKRDRKLSLKMVVEELLRRGTKSLFSERRISGKKNKRGEKGGEWVLPNNIIGVLKQRGTCSKQGTTY